MRWLFAILYVLGGLATGAAAWVMSALTHGGPDWAWVIGCAVLWPIAVLAAIASIAWLAATG